MNPASPLSPHPAPTRPVPRERRMRRTQWAEVALTLLTLLGMAILLRFPTWILAFLALITPLGLGLTLWQYRTMDEFRRARFLKAWAGAGVVGMLTLSGLIAWNVFGGLVESGAANTPEASTHHDLTLSVWLLYIPWSLGLLTFYAVTAFLYRRDTRG